jgi:MFS family permease
MLQDKGFTSVEAGKLFSVFGFSLVAGRVCVGFLIDRMWAPAVAFVVVFFSAMGALLFLVVDSHAGILMLSIGLLGMGAGAEFDLAAFLVSRYCGLRDYARLFGLQMGVISAGTSIAPLVVAFLYEHTGTYVIVMTANVGFLLVAAFILLALGRYPVFTSKQAVPAM